MATTALQSLTKQLSNRFELNTNENELLATLKNTAFKQAGKKYKDNNGNWKEMPAQAVTNDQMMALLIIANQYSLNPWTKEIYAFPDKNNGITPIVGVDGWSRIINDHPQFDGVEFKQDNEQCTCIIYRKDRSHPISVTEYMCECNRDTGPWQTHPKRMLRHKALIQCARLSFGFTGIYDKDEAERIVETEEPINVTPKANVIDVTGIELITPEQLEQMKSLIDVTKANEHNLLAYAGNVESLEKITKSKAEEVIGMLLSKLNKQQVQDESNDEDIPL